jgi:hypothetical protein
MQALSPHMHSKLHYHTHAFKTSLTIMHASSLTKYAFKALRLKIDAHDW